MGLLGRVQAAVTRVSFGKEAALAAGTEYLSIKDTLMSGEEVSMGDYVGDVCVVVNVASKYVVVFCCVCVCVCVCPYDDDVLTNEHD